jgi:hypothetical protein
MIYALHFKITRLFILRSRLIPHLSSFIYGMIITILCSMHYACDEENSSKTLDRIDIEGPSAVISQPGPWLIRIYHKSLKSIENYQIETYDTQGLLNTYPLVVSGRSHIYWSVIDNSLLDTEIRYIFREIDSDSILMEDYFTYRSYIGEESTEDLIIPCQISLASPQNAQLNLSQDEGAAAGMQGTLVFNVNQILDGIVILKIQEVMYLSRVYQNQAKFPAITLPMGRQRLSLKGIGNQNEKCKSDLSFTVIQ